MLKTQDLINELGEEYKPMIKQIQIAEFTKCIAQFSGLKIQEVSDAAIKNYLVHWAKGKFKFFKLMNNNIRVDIPLTYYDEDRDYSGLMVEIGRRYPAYWPWLRAFKKHTHNKIDYDLINWQDMDLFDILPDMTNQIKGMAITRFFKNKLKANDDLVTELGKVYENNEVSAVFTISIDPVDMMLASENPYDWNSCYRLELGNSDSHADGCLAAVIDDSSLISYVWNNEGKFKLYHNYELKSIRYKRMRMWFSLSEHMTTIHFNTIYPGKNAYSKGFVQQIRYVVEQYISKQLNVQNMWKHGKNGIYRDYSQYGYDEFDEDYLFYQVDSEEERIFPYNHWITCPCGCGQEIPGSQCGDGVCYNGEGFTAENFSEEIYCDNMDEYTDCDGNCYECSIWRENHPVCELDPDQRCERDTYEAQRENDFDPEESNIMSCNPEHCKGCPLYKYHHPETDPNAADIAYEESKLSAGER